MMRALLVALALRADVAEAAEPACRQSLAKSCSGDLPADAAARGVLAPVNLRGDAPKAPRPHCMAVHVAEVDRHISRTILRQGSYGHAHIFAAIFNATPGSLYLDVGANIGFHTLQAAAAGMRTVSWEPHPVNQALLRWSLERNCFRHVHLVPSPAGAPDQLGAIMNLTVHVATPGLSTLAAPSRIRGSKRLSSDLAAGRVYPVTVGTVDSDLGRLCADRAALGRSHGAPRHAALLKVDVEGFEARALSGAASLLAGTLSCDGAPLESPMIVHVEIFPALIRGAGNEPEAPLRMLAATHDLFIGVGEGIGGARAVSEHHAEWAKLGKRLRHGGGRAFELPSEHISAFVASVERRGGHVDVIAQRRAPPVPAELDLRSESCVLYRGASGGGASWLRNLQETLSSR